MTRTTILAVCLLSAVCTTAAREAPAAALQATGHELPAVVLLMRHAEKPEGEKGDPNLTKVGYQRAALLPALFNPGPTGLPRPDALFATSVSKHSNRPVETITPLSEALHLPINHDYEDHESGVLAKKLISGAYGNKVVLVAWHHGELQHFAQALGVIDAPAWPDDTFDVIWRIEWVNGLAKLTVVHEHLLHGDSQ